MSKGAFILNAKDGDRRSLSPILCVHFACISVFRELADVNPNAENGRVPLKIVEALDSLRSNLSEKSTKTTQAFDTGETF